MRRAVYSLVIVALLSLAVWACNVPVYRYALDHWSADKYRATIIHQGLLSPDAAESLRQLSAAAESNHCNLSIRVLDTAGTLSEEDQRLLKSLSINAEDTASKLVLQYPPALDLPQPIMTCALDSAALNSLVDSPVRRELQRRLAAGQSAVWLLVKGRNSQLAAAAEQVIEKELRHLQATLELPKLTDDPADKVVGGPDLRVEFSLLTLDRTGPDEKELIQILVNSEADLDELEEPILFAAFGRGRILWPLVGPGISAENIKEMASFVTGACSCQVKEQNPGFDLLMKADWTELLPWTKLQTAPAVVDPNVPPELVPIPKGNRTAASEIVESPEPADKPVTADEGPRVPVVSVTEMEVKQLPAQWRWEPIVIVVSLVILVPLLGRWLRRN